MEIQVYFSDDTIQFFPTNTYLLKENQFGKETIDWEISIIDGLNINGTEMK